MNIQEVKSSLGVGSIVKLFVKAIVILCAFVLIAGCGDEENVPPPPPSAPVPAFPTASVTALPTSVPATPSPVAVATVVPTPTAEVDAITKRLVLREYTPLRTQGTYYPISDFVSVDNDLTLMPGATEGAGGKVLLLSGVVYDAEGILVEGAEVQIWQTDVKGVYLHPDHPRFGERDKNFQGYGKSVTDSEGAYDFRTILPETYEFAPRHIHVKVKFEDFTLLNTHFYFEERENVPEVLIVDMQEGVDDSGNPVLIGKRDVFLRDFVVLNEQSSGRHNGLPLQGF